MKGEPLTVLVMPKIIVPERMFDVNDLSSLLLSYCISQLYISQYIDKANMPLFLHIKRLPHLTRQSEVTIFASMLI